MAKLTHGDIQELTAFFASPLNAAFGHELGAQTYEPRGKAGYDPCTDTKLVSMVFSGIRSGKNQWARMKRVIDLLTDAQVEVLRVVCRSGRQGVACRVPEALEAGRSRTRQEQRLARLEAVYEASAKQASPMTAAMRVLEAERRPFTPAPMSENDLVRAAQLALEDGLVNVDAETDALIDGAADAYHEARAQVAAWRRGTESREEQRRADFRESLRAERETKVAARFERKLRGAA